MKHLFAAEFMASLAVSDAASGHYVLGPPLKTVPENNTPSKTRNPASELSYWRFGLRTAQQWRTRLGLPPDAGWNKVGFSSGGPFPHFPSNGTLLYAVALMTAGWDGAPERNAPAFPMTDHGN